MLENNKQMDGDMSKGLGKLLWTLKGLCNKTDMSSGEVTLQGDLII